MEEVQEEHLQPAVLILLSEHYLLLQVAAEEALQEVLAPMAAAVEVEALQQVLVADAHLVVVVVVVVNLVDMLLLNRKIEIHILVEKVHKAAEVELG